MSFVDLYANNIWETPEEHYKNFNQAVMDSYWQDTTQIRTIKEENYPFDNTYVEQEALVDTVSEFITNTQKVSGDYIKVTFRDIDHTLNHRGQKYLYAPDGVSENTYLCYDKLNPLTQIPDFKAIRCNNHLTIMLEDGSIIKEPCAIGYEITGTNNNITKDATVNQRRMVILVQGNNNTKDIKLNQRFIFQHKQAYKITEMNVLNQEDYNDENVTLYTLYVEWSTLSAQDNLELNVADYYQYDYKLSINSTDLSLSNGATGQLTSTVLLNDAETTNVPVQWSTSDVSVVTIDSQGNYHVVGESGSTASITCSIVGHTEVSDSINLSVVATPVVVKELIVSPSGTISLLQNREQTITYGVYANGVLQSDVVTVSPSGANTSNYTIVYGVNSLTVKNVLKSTTSLTLTFTSGTMSQVVTIKLGGII
jgi:hypothetical protein